MSEAGLRIDGHAGSVSPPALNGQTNGAAADAATASAGVSIEIVVPPSPGAGGAPPESGGDAAAGQGDQPATPGAEEVQGPRSGGPRVADIRKNSFDGRGEKIDFVFFRRPNFAIYRSGGRIMVQYADNQKTAAEQIANIAELLPLRDHLQSLSSSLGEPDTCHWQIAETLRLGLDGQKDAARQTMERAIAEINAMRVRRGRIVYLEYAGALVVVVMALFGGGAAAVKWYGSSDLQKDGLGLLFLATASGAIGALLSTAIALRDRSVAIDGDVISNAVDSTVRIMIGVISAAALFVMLSSTLLPSVSPAALVFEPKSITWKIALLIGFMAGFVERFVPDLLEKQLSPISK